MDTGTGDVTLSLSTSGVSAGTYGSSTIIPVISVDAYGRVTNINSATVSGGGGGGGSSVRCEQTFTATANQTLIEGLTCTLTAGYFDVFINGVKVNSSSFTNTSTTITFTDGLAAGDIVDVVNYGIFSTSVTAANGFTGTVQNATTTPEITLSTSVTGILKGSVGSLVAATAGTDYQAPISLTTTGSSGGASFSSNVLNIPNYTLAGLGGQPLATNLTSLAGLSYASTSFVKMTAAGTFALDTNTYYLASNPSGYTTNTGTVTSVAALTITSTAATDITSTVATGTTTPVITLNIPTASSTARGVVSTGAQTFAGVKTFSNSPIISSHTQGRILYAGVNGTLTDLSAFTYTLNASSTSILTFGDAVNDAQIKFNYGNAKGGDFTAQRQGVDQLSFGFNNSGAFGGTAGTDSGRLMYFYDRVSLAYIGAVSSTNFYIGASTTNYGLNVARPNASIAGVTVKATGQVQFNTYTSTTSFTGTAAGYLAFTSAGDLIAVAAASGTVTSVALSLPAIFTVSGSPVTTSGTLTASLASQTANTFFAAPDGAAGAPTFRTILSTDIPNLDASKIAAGQLTVQRGGTGNATLTGVLIGNGISAFSGVTGTASQLLRRNSGNTVYEFFSPGNLTKTDDTNVTLTLGGTPTGALINAVSLTLGWTGTLSVARGGTGLSALGTANQLIRVNAGATALEYFTPTYLTANQTITLSGAVTGSGSTTITTTLGTGVVGITNLSATGTPSSTTYLRGDGTWATPAGGGGSSSYTVTSQTANYTETATSGTKIIKCDTTGGAFTVTLPTAVGNAATLIIKKTAGSASLTVDGNASETIDGGATAVLNLADESITLVSDNANWLII